VKAALSAMVVKTDRKDARHRPAAADGQVPAGILQVAAGPGRRPCFLARRIKRLSARQERAHHSAASIMPPIVPALVPAPFGAISVGVERAPIAHPH